jgi:hypothetical protein
MFPTLLHVVKNPVNIPLLPSSNQFENMFKQVGHPVAYKVPLIEKKIM